MKEPLGATEDVRGEVDALETGKLIKDPTILENDSGGQSANEEVHK